jgi:hypothetical protein
MQRKARRAQNRRPPTKLEFRHIQYYMRDKTRRISRKLDPFLNTKLGTLDKLIDWFKRGKK